MKNSNQTLVLTVDDDPDNRKLIERFLSSAGYRVLSAEDGSSALTLVREAPPDLILLDVTMPGMDGYQVCAELQADPRHSLIPVIFLTALSDKHDRAKGFSLGAVDYVSKPIVKPLLLAKVAEQLKTGARWQALAPLAAA